MACFAISHATVEGCISVNGLCTSLQPTSFDTQQCTVQLTLLLGCDAAMQTAWDIKSALPSAVLRYFTYMPLMHSEDLKDQEVGAQAASDTLHALCVHNRCAG